MWKFLEKLRSLPEGSRKMVVLFSSAGITVIILVSWLVFPVPHFGTLSNAEKGRKSAEELITPFSVIGGEIHNSAGGIKEKWTSLGGTAGMLSLVSSALKENSTTKNATSTTATTTLEKNAVSAQEAFLNDSNVGSPKNEMVATTTATTTPQ